MLDTDLQEPELPETFYFRPYNKDWEDRDITELAINRIDIFLDRIVEELPDQFPDDIADFQEEFEALIDNREIWLRILGVVRNVPQNVFPTIAMQEILPKISPYHFKNKNEVWWVVLAILARDCTL